MSLRHVCEIVRPARLDVGASAKKFAQRAENTPILVFLGLLGEFFRGSAAVGAVLGEQFRGPIAAGIRLGEFRRACGPRWSVAGTPWGNNQADAVD